MTPDNHQPRPVVLRATRNQLQRASLLAQQRQKGHDHCRTRSQSLGSNAANYQADYWGAKAEIVLLDALTQAGLDPIGNLLAFHPPFGMDLHVGGRLFDVKASPPDKRYVCINAKAHETAEPPPDAYVPCLFIAEDTMRVCAPVPHCIVTLKWDWMNNSRTPYYSTARMNLPPLYDLTDLLRPF